MAYLRSLRCRPGTERNTMTAQKLTEYIGQTVSWPRGRMNVTCTVKDAKQSYGCIRLLIVPLDGSGETWVNLDSVTLGKEEEK